MINEGKRPKNHVQSRQVDVTAHLRKLVCSCLNPESFDLFFRILSGRNGQCVSDDPPYPSLLGPYRVDSFAYFASPFRLNLLQVIGGPDVIFCHCQRQLPAVPQGLADLGSIQRYNGAFISAAIHGEIKTVAGAGHRAPRVKSS
jgi:hypothetical protein